MTSVISFKWHGPGQCCCEEPGPYDWYMDSNDGDDKTAATIYFGRVPSVITVPPMASSLYIANSSYPSCWYIEATTTKTIDMSICGGYQSTGGIISEHVITEETRPFGEASDSFIVVYDCIADEELDDYQYTEADGYSDYVTQYPAVIAQMNTGWAVGSLSFEGFQVGYDSLIRGIIDFNPVALEDVGYWVTFTYSPISETITKSTIEFDVDDMVVGTFIINDYIEDPEDPDTTVKRWLYHAIPQSVAPRYWPYAAGVEHTQYKYVNGPWVPTTSVTIYPGARCLVGAMSCSSGSPGELTFPTPATEHEVLEVVDSAGITGCWGNVQDLCTRHRFDVRLYDQSPGGYILLLYYRLTEYSGDLGTYPPGTFTSWYEYYVRCFVCGHEVTASPYETDDTWAHLWGDSCHAVHKHPSEDDYWLFCIGERATEESAWKLKCYNENGGEHWVTPESTNANPPVVLWSSDRWIYVTNLYFASDDGDEETPSTVERVTRGLWPQYGLQNDHGDWLISHNKHDHPDEDDMPYYVPAGLRYQSNGDWILAEKWMCEDLKYDVVKTSRILPCTPDDEPY